jgi:lipid A 3-O-deacylase
MKRRSLLFILSISLLVLAACSENKTSSPKKTKDKPIPDLNKGKKQQQHIRADGTHLLISRYMEEKAVNQEEVSSGTGPDHNFEYYTPVTKIKRKSLIPEDLFNEINRKAIEIKMVEGRSLTLRTPFLFKTAKTSPEIFFTAVFDNDIFDYTDYYYTNGISLELYHPVINNSPICRILPGLKNSLNYYGLILIQNMYTPRKLEELNVRVGDRPFAAYLTISHHRISLSAGRHRRLQSELALGTIGPASLGGIAQDVIHTNTPVGWVNQVKNDVVVNYNIRFDQGVYSGNGIEVAVIAGGQAGTLYNNIMGGLYLQIGKANDRYESLFQTTPHQKTFKGRIRYYFSIDAKTRLVMYDATLQGGMFNRESVYSLDAQQVKHYVFTGTASFGLGLGRYSLEAEQVFLTPEFDGGRHHLWFRIKNIFYLN